MGRNKTSGIKKRILKEVRMNSAVPTWAIVRTKRKVRTHPQRRNWRRSSIDVR